MPRQEHPYPSIIQALFGISFILFLVFFDRVQALRPAGFPIIWAWSGLQAALGIWLIRRRIRARIRILRCIRCGQALR